MLNPGPISSSEPDLGPAAFRALGVAPSTFHMNEGHAAFLTLELIREKMAAGKSFEEAGALTKAGQMVDTRPRRARPAPQDMDEELPFDRCDVPATS